MHIYYKLSFFNNRNTDILKIVDQDECIVMLLCPVSLSGLRLLEDTITYTL